MLSFILHRAAAHFRPALQSRFKPALHAHFNPAQLVVVAMLFCLCACLDEPTDSSPDFLPMDDSVYPYAGLPRVVIETENFAGIRDRETEIP